MKIKLDPIQTILALALKFYGGHDYLNYVVIQYGGMVLGSWIGSLLHFVMIHVKMIFVLSTWDAPNYATKKYFKLLVCVHALLPLLYWLELRKMMLVFFIKITFLGLKEVLF
jgi:hypothetical protein